MFAGLFVGTILFGWVADKYAGDLQLLSDDRLLRLCQLGGGSAAKYHVIDRSTFDQLSVIPVPTRPGLVTADGLDSRLDPFFDLIQQLSKDPIFVQAWALNRPAAARAGLTLI